LFNVVIHFYSSKILLASWTILQENLLPES